MTLSVSTIAIVILVGLVAFFAVKWLFNKDTEIENRRRAAAELAATLRGVGLELIPEFLIDYSVGDYSGMAQKIVNLTRTFLKGEKAVMVEFQRVFENLLAAKLQTEEGRMSVKARLDEATQAAHAAKLGPAPTQPAA